MFLVCWMLFESVKYGCFINELDIWVFGVVFWEIYSYGRQLYYGYFNEEVSVLNLVILEFYFVGI